MASARQFACRSFVLSFSRSFLYVTGCHSFCPVFNPIQASALASEQERKQDRKQEPNPVELEETEKRLRATLLTAKRETSTSNSRVASPAVGLPASDQSDTKAGSSEEQGTPMEVDASSPPKEVSSLADLLYLVIYINIEGTLDS